MLEIAKREIPRKQIEKKNCFYGILPELLLISFGLVGRYAERKANLKNGLLLLMLVNANEFFQEFLAIQ